jgi:hypothetical protein
MISAEIFMNVLLLPLGVGGRRVQYTSNPDNFPGILLISLPFCLHSSLHDVQKPCAAHIVHQPCKLFICATALLPNVFNASLVNSPSPT